VFWEHTSDLHLPLGGAVHEWLVVSSISGLVIIIIIIIIISSSSSSSSLSHHNERSNTINWPNCVLKI